MQLHLYNLVAHHKATGHRHLWRLCAGSQGYKSRSDDDPPSVTWLPLVGQWASVAVRAAAEGSQVEIDDLRLINVRLGEPRAAMVEDLTANQWLEVPLGPRPLNRLLTDYFVLSVTELVLDEGAPLDTAVVVWQSRAGIIQADQRELKLPVYDRQKDFDTPVQGELRYAGTGGLEGPATLKNVLKERTWGYRPMVQPTYLGILDGLHTWSVNGGLPIKDVPRGLSGGVAVTRITSGTPLSWQLLVNPADGIIRTAVQFDDFRVDVEGDMQGGVWRRHPGALIGHLATTHGGIVAGADTAGLDVPPRTVGLHLPAGDGRSFRDVFGRLAGSVARGRWWVDPTADRIVATRLPPAGSVAPVRSYGKAAGTTPGLRPIPTTDVFPCKQVTVLYAENAGAAGTAAPDASADDAARWTQQWLESDSAVDTVIAAAYGVSARKERIETALSLKADADAEAPLFLAERAYPPRPYELPVPDGAPGVAIGQGVRVTDDTAGFEDGATAVVFGRTNRNRGGGATLYVER